MEKIAIIIPAYNEEKRIGKTLESYLTFFDKLEKNDQLDCDILVVINNTKDKTEEIVKDFIKKNKNLKYLNLVKGGKGYAIIEGFKYLLNKNYDLLGFVDADMATSPEEYYKLILAIKNFDGIIASRYLKNSIIEPKPTIQRLIARRMFNFFIRIMLFLPYRDTQCGAKIFKKYVIKNILPHITMSKWAFDVDLLYSIKKNGFKIKEMPSKWSDKEYSKINFWEAGPWMAFAILRLRILNSRFKHFIKIYDRLLNKFRDKR